MKQSIGIAASAESAKHNEISGLMKFHTTPLGDAYLMPIPDLFGRSAFHMSFHASGKAHLRAHVQDETLTEDLPLQDLMRNVRPSDFESTMEKIVRPPTPGYKALIMMGSLSSNFLVPLSRHRLVLDMESLLEHTTIALLDDTARLPYALKWLRETGRFNDSMFLSTTNLETTQMSIFRPLQTPQQDDQYSRYVREIGES